MNDFHKVEPGDLFINKVHGAASFVLASQDQQVLTSLETNTKGIIFLHFALAYWAPWKKAWTKNE